MSFKHQGSLVIWTLTLLAFVATAGIAVAFQSPERHDANEISLKEFDLYNYTSSAVTAGRTQAEAAFASVNGGSWQTYSWNPQTGTPHLLWGSGVQLAASFVTNDDFVNAARNVIQSNPSVFKADLNNLRIEATPAAAGKHAVRFQQTYHGLDVYGGRVMLVFTDQGRLFVAGSDYYPNISVDSNPAITSTMAKDIATRSISFNPATDSVEDGATLMVLPVPLTETQVEYHLVWQVRVHVADPVAVWVTSIDAHSGEVIWRYNYVDFTNFVGTTHGQVQRPSYCEGQSLNVLPYLRIQVAGQAAVYADHHGNWIVPYSGTDAKTVTADLYSPYVDLNNLGGSQGTFTGTATPGTPLDVLFTDSNSQKDEKDVYAAINDIHEFYKDIDSTYVYTNQRITAYVRRPGTCNAYWDGTINFYATGGGCHNTGEIMGVAYHEFCHGITDQIFNHGDQSNQGIGEGNSDIISNLMLQEAIIGRGFYDGNCSSGIRNSENTLIYPDDVIGQEIHAAGQVIAGFHWDSMQDLQARYGISMGTHITANTWHHGRVLLSPRTQPDQVFATFVADDDDGNIDNGTPHYDSFAVGALNHGFTPPPILTGVFITHDPVSSRTEEGDVPVLALITSTEAPLVADSLRLNYRINGGTFAHQRLIATGQPDQFSGTIPSLHRGDVVEYYLRARDTQGNTKTAPEAGVYTFDIATIIDHFESASGWAVNLESTDNATSGLWIQADPVGTIYNGHTIQPENDHTEAPGTICWVTGNGTVGGAAGEQDVDGGATSVYSASYDLTGATTARVKYWKWYTDDLGVNAGDDTWVVQVRNNGGNWVDVERTTASPNGWVLIDFDLFAAFGENLGTVQFKFIANDTGANSLLEALIDDFELMTVTNSATPEPSSGPSRFALLGGRPNPARDATAISFQIPVRASVQLGVYDVSGRLVQSLASGPFGVGVHTVTWDGRDSQGHNVASGVYYCKMHANEFNATRTVVLTK